MLVVCVLLIWGGGRLISWKGGGPGVERRCVPVRERERKEVRENEKRERPTHATQSAREV